MGGVQNVWVLLSGEWNSRGCQWNHKHLWISFERCTAVARLTPTYLSALSLKEASSFAVVCVYALLKLLFFLVPYQLLMLRGLKLYSFCDRSGSNDCFCSESDLWVEVQIRCLLSAYVLQSKPNVVQERLLCFCEECKCVWVRLAELFT